MLWAYIPAVICECVMTAGPGNPHRLILEFFSSSEVTSTKKIKNKKISARENKRLQNDGQSRREL